MLLAALAFHLLPSAATASESSFFLSDVQVLYDAPVGPSLALVGPAPAQPAFDYALFATEVFAYVAKEVLRDSPDEFAGNSLIPSTLSSGMPATDHDFGDHCLKVVKDLGSGISSVAPMPSIGGVGRAPVMASYAGQAIGAAFGIREVWRLIRNDIVENRSEGFSLHPKLGSNKIALSLTIRW